MTTTDGTGVVHTAGAFGEDDKVVTDREGIEPVMPVGPTARFTFPVAEYEGMQVFDANALIIDHLKAATRGEGEHRRRSPRARCCCAARPTTTPTRTAGAAAQPLIYKAVSSWFVEVTKFKDRMVELNQRDHLGARARQGRPVRQVARERPRLVDHAEPVLGQPDPRVALGQPGVPADRRLRLLRRARARLRAPAAQRDGEPDLHRPFVDELTRPNPDDPTGRSTMRRVEDVLDVWFDSGSMSFAQVHYPFENAEWFEHHFPGDFIVEYIGQTRGWFYTLHVLATALFDRPAFSSCISHGIVLGNDGQKMSKSLRNYPDVPEVFDRDGADAMRWFLMSSPILRGGNLVVTEEAIREGVRQVLIPLWNSWYFFSLYANAYGDGQRVCRVVVDRVHRAPRPLPAGQAAPARRDDDRPARRPRRRRRLRLGALPSSTC